MRRLIISNTYSQMICAFQLKATIFVNDFVTLLISDHSVDARTIANRVDELAFFSEVLFFSTNGAANTRSSWERFQDYYEISFRENNRYTKYLAEIKDKYFDELLVFNYSIETYGIFSALCMKNPNIKVSLYEESILNYNTQKLSNIKRKIINFTRIVLGKPVISKALSNFYCFYPCLYTGKLNPVEIKKIGKDSQLIPLLKRVFNVEDNIEYREKYIFFASIYDFEGGKPVGELSLVSQIAKYVGKENLIVKQHPRDKRSVFKDGGIKVDARSSTPWEVLMMCGDYQDKVFLSINSTSLITSSLLIDRGIEGYYLYRLCDISRNRLAKQNISVIEKLLSDVNLAERLSNIQIADSLDEIGMK